MHYNLSNQEYLIHEESTRECVMICEMMNTPEGLGLKLTRTNNGEEGAVGWTVYSHNNHPNECYDGKNFEF